MVFLVVSFLLDDSVAIVLSSWIKVIDSVKILFYPNSEDSYSFLKIVEPREDWKKIYNYKIEAEEENYDDAVCKLKRVIDYSDVETDFDDRGKPIRRAKRKAAALLEDTCNIQFHDEFDRLENMDSRFTKHTKLDLRKSPPKLIAPSIPSTATNCTQIYSKTLSNVAQLSCLGQSVSLASRNPSTYIADSNNVKKQRSKSSFSDSDASFSGASQYPISVMQNKEDERNTQVVSNSLISTLNSIVKGVATLISQNQELLKNQSIMISALQTKGIGVLDESDFLPDNLYFPLKTDDDIILLDSWLHSKENRKKLITYISTFGGIDVKSSVRIILKKMLSNTTAQCYNWDGTPPKKSFKQYVNIIKVINCAINSKYSGTQVQVESVMRSWLANAKKRIGKPMKDKASTYTNTAAADDSDS